MEPNLASSTYLHMFYVYDEARGIRARKGSIYRVKHPLLVNNTRTISNYLLNGVILQMKQKIPLSMQSLSECEQIKAPPPIPNLLHV